MEERWGLAMSIREPDASTWVEPHEVIVPDISIIPADRKTRLPFIYAHGTAIRIAEQIDGFLVSEVCPLIKVKAPKVSFHIKLASIAEARDDVRTHVTHRKPGDRLGEWELDESLIVRWREDKLAFLNGHLARLQWQIDFSGMASLRFVYCSTLRIFHWATPFRAFIYMIRSTLMPCLEDSRAWS